MVPVDVCVACATARFPRKADSWPIPHGPSVTATRPLILMAGFSCCTLRPWQHLERQHSTRLYTHRSGQHIRSNFSTLYSNITSVGRGHGIPLWTLDVEQVLTLPILKKSVSFNLMLKSCKGQATTELVPFKRVVGVDPSANMINAAREYTASSSRSTNSQNVPQFEYVQGNAENLSFLKGGSVDLIIAGPQRSIYHIQTIT